MSSIERGHRLVEVRRAELQRVEDVVVDRVVVPVLHPAAQRPGQFGRDDLHAGLDQPPGHEQLLAPRVSPVAVADLRAFAGSGRTPAPPPGSSAG